MKYIVLFFCFVFWTGAFAQNAHKDLRKADKNYEATDFAEAEKNYRRALEAEKNAKSRYNLGNAIYKQGDRFDSAIEAYEEVTKSAADDEVKSNAFYNMGNAYFQKKEYQKSIDAYKNALRLDPKDMDTKKNLSIARRYLQQQMQQQQQEQQQQEKQNEENDSDNQKDNQKSDKQDNENQEDKNDDSNEESKPSDGDKNNDEENSKPEKSNPDEMTREDAEQLLDIINNDDKKVQEKLKKQQAGPSKSDKDW